MYFLNNDKLSVNHFSHFLSFSFHAVSVSLCSHCLSDSVQTFVVVFDQQLIQYFKIHTDIFQQSLLHIYYPSQIKPYQYCMLFIKVVFMGSQRV
jgi:hypothetical protein